MDAFINIFKNVLIFIALAVPGFILVKTKILKSDEVITINIYTNIIGKIEKYEIIYKDKKEQREISYLIPTKEISLIKNDEVVYKILTEEDGSKKLFNIYNNTNQEQGKLIFDKTDKRTTISLNLKDKEKTIDLIYDSKIDNIKRKPERQLRHPGKLITE